MRKSMLLGICAKLIAIGAFAQTTPVTGKVMDDDKGAPVSRVRVLEKGIKNVIRYAGNTSYQEVFIKTVGSEIICLCLEK